MFTATLLWLSLLGTSTTSETLERTYYQSMIELKSHEYGLDPEKMLRIAKCESNFKKDALGDHGKAYGLYQFHRGTFDTFKNEWGHSWLDYHSPEDNIELAMYAFSKGYDSHWTCK